jgi:hypothetical protein
LKKVLALVLALVMAFSVVACAKPAEPAAPAAGDAAAAPAADAGKGKIAIYTGTVSQNEEEFRSMEVAAEKYPDMIVSQTYPDSFTKEQETLISNAVGLVADPEVKVLIMNQAVQGAAAAFDKVREARPDVLILAFQPGETDVIAAKADVAVTGDEAAQGYMMPEQAKKMGAKTFVHYSFPRHMSYPLIVQRREILVAECERLGIKFVDATAPDPTGDAGLPGAQQFILEDIPRKVAEYGKDTNFFSTNCGMQEPLLKASVEQGAIVAQQCCPSPFHGYPGALGISLEGHSGDSKYMVEQIKAKLTEKGVSGRFSSYAFPLSMVSTAALVEYGKMYIEGQLKDKNDPEALKACYEKVSDGYKIYFDNYKMMDKDNKEVVQENFYLVLADYITF